MADPITRVGRTVRKRIKEGVGLKHKFTVAVDFDHTIMNPDDVPEGKRLGNPYPGAQEVLHQLEEAGARIVLHTARAWKTDDVQYLWDYLRHFQIPCQEIVGKFPADIYVDDRAVEFDHDLAKGWDAIATDVLTECYRVKWAKQP